MSQEKKSSVVEQHALDKIPDSERKSWVSISMIWGGAMICVSSLMMGGTLISGLPLGQAILAGVIGYTVVIAFMVFQGMQGADLGRPTVVSAASAFGKAGSRIVISFVIGVSVMGWFGVQCNITGAAFSGILQQVWGTDFPIWLSSAIWGIIMLTTAIIGYKALSYLNYIAVPALIVLSVYGVIAAINKYGMDALTTSQPAQPFSFMQGIALTVGGFAVGGVIAADYSRYAKNRKESAISSIIGVWPLGILLVVAGALMSIVAGTYDMTQVVTDLGMPFIGMVILILATWTTNTVNAYSGGLALTNLFNLKSESRALATAIAGIIGTLLAITGILNYFVNFLMILTAGISPVAGVMIADYWIKRKADPDSWNPQPGVSWIAVVAWLAGFAVGYFVKWGIAPVNAIIVSMLASLILDAAFGKKVFTKQAADM